MSRDQERRLEEVLSIVRDLPLLERAAFLERTWGEMANCAGKPIRISPHANGPAILPVRRLADIRQDYGNA